MLNSIQIHMGRDINKFSEDRLIKFKKLEFYIELTKECKRRIQSGRYFGHFLQDKKPDKIINILSGIAIARRIIAIPLMEFLNSHFFVLNGRNFACQRKLRVYINEIKYILLF